MRKRVWCSLLRRKINRSVLLLLILLTALIYIGMVVYQASEKNMREIEQSYGSSFTINSLKDESNADFWKDISVGEDVIRAYVGPRVSEELLARASENVEGISGYEIELAETVFQEDWSAVPGYYSNHLIELNQELAETDTEEEKVDLLAQKEYTAGWRATFEVRSAVNSQNYEKFYDGTFELAEGRHFNRTDQGVILMSRELGERNGFQVGDRLTLHSYFIDKDLYAWEGDWESEVELVGLFDATYTQAVSEFSFEFDIMANLILVDMNTMLELREADGLLMTASDGIFFVEDASITEAVMEQVKALDWIDWNYYYLERNDSLYQEAIKPLKTIKVIMGVGLGIVAAAGIALLYLVLTHSTGQREREAGILLALGIPAKEIRWQFLTENLILGAAAYLLAAGIAVSAAPAVGDQLLGAYRTVWEPKTYTEEEFAAALQQGDTELVHKITRGQRDGVPAPETLDIQIEGKYPVLVALLEGLIILACTYGALGKTLKWEPAKVLSMVR